eukprot:Amastigsp_a179828_143.p3 type:complete len:152 gc:universal Amastigsp_a179828_143:448-903(+)
MSVCPSSPRTLTMAEPIKSVEPSSSQSYTSMLSMRSRSLAQRAQSGIEIVPHTGDSDLSTTGDRYTAKNARESGLASRRMMTKGSDLAPMPESHLSRSEALIVQDATPCDAVSLTSWAWMTTEPRSTTLGFAAPATRPEAPSTVVRGSKLA